MVLSPWMSEWGGAGEMMAAWRHEQSDVSGATVHNVRRGATQLLLKNHPPGATETRYFTEFAKVYDYAASVISKGFPSIVREGFPYIIWGFLI